MNKQHDSLVPHPPLQDYYENEGQRRHFVSNLFDGTAHHYDWIIRAMSFGTGDYYRRDALVRARLRKGMHVLDVATGTGPVAKMEAVITGKEGMVIGLDRSINMLKEANKKIAIPLVHAGADHLPFSENRFNFLSMGYALRHVDDLATTFNEYYRVLKPGGTVLILELTRPDSKIGYLFIKFYLHVIVPFIARIGSRTKDAEVLMKYFWDTIDSCVPPKMILETMQKAGFKNVKRHRVFSIFSEYIGIKKH